MEWTAYFSGLNLDPFVTGGFFLYLLAVLIIGFWTYRRNKSQEDYLLAGRSLGPWVTAFSERASGESAWLLLGMPGVGLAVGMGEIWTALGCIAGIIFSWYVVSYPLRVETQRYGAVTLPEFFSAGMGGNDKVIQVLASCIILFFFTFYVSAQFIGAGKVLKVTFGIPQELGVYIGAAVILFYTILGGFMAVAWTDLLQGIIMIGTLIILPLAAFIEFYQTQSISLSTALIRNNPHSLDIFNNKTGLLAITHALGGLSWGLGYVGQPHLLTRFMAIRDPEKLKTGRTIAIVWAVPAFFGALFIGILGSALYGTGTFPDPERIMPYMATHLLPAWLAGILISGAIAAMMSTADSQLLVTTSAVTEDFFHRIFKYDPPPKTLVLISRITTLLIGSAAVIMALKQQKLVFHLVSYAWSGLGASFGPALLLSLYWKRVNRFGVIAGMLTGSLVTIFWSRSPVDQYVSHRLAAWVLAFVAVMVASLVTERKQSDHTGRT